jgi:GNAT superfamily N-acetyltransferase
MRIVIRRATRDDAHSLAELNGDVQDFHFEHHPSYFRKAAGDEVADWFRSLIPLDGIDIWIAEADSEPVGYALAITHSREANPFCRPRKWIEIDQIGVRKDMQRTGIARRMVDQVRRTAEEKGIEAIELASWSFNGNAHMAFEKLGFTPRLIRFGMELEKTVKEPGK